MTLPALSRFSERLSAVSSGQSVNIVAGLGQHASYHIMRYWKGAIHHCRSHRSRRGLPL